MDYYRTSGEAVQKASALVHDIRAFIPHILAREDTEEMRVFAAEVHAAMDEANRFREDLITARATAVWLECSPEEGAVMCRRVDPRYLSQNIE